MPIQKLTSIQQSNLNRLNTIKQLTRTGRHVEASDLFKSSIAQAPAKKTVSKLGAVLQEMVNELKGRITKK